VASTSYRPPAAAVEDEVIYLPAPPSSRRPLFDSTPATITHIRQLEDDADVDQAALLAIANLTRKRAGPDTPPSDSIVRFRPSPGGTVSGVAGAGGVQRSRDGRFFMSPPSAAQAPAARSEWEARRQAVFAAAEQAQQQQLRSPTLGRSPVATMGGRSRLRRSPTPESLRGGVVSVPSRSGTTPHRQRPPPNWGALQDEEP
jgi:hypothetical protein